MAAGNAGWELLCRHRPFRQLWLALAISATSLEIGWMAVLWLALQQGGTGAAVGGTLLVYGLPAGAAGLLAGALLDRFPRARVMAADQFLRALILIGAALVGLASSPYGHVEWVYAFTLALGMVTPITQAGAPALLAELVPEKHLEAANYLSQLQWQVAVLLGPPLGGALLDLWQPAPVLLLTAALCLLSGLLIWTLPGPSPHNPGPARLAVSWADVVEGLRYLRASPALGSLTALTFAFNLLYGPMEAVLPLLAERQLGGATALGLIWLAYGIGSMAGSAWLAGHPWPLLPSWTLALVPVAWGLITAGVALADSLGTLLLLMLVGGLTFAPFPPTATTVRQRLVPRELHGRIFGITAAVTAAGTPLGAWIGGILADAVGPRGILWISGLALVALGLLFWASPSLRALDAAAPLPEPTRHSLTHWRHRRP